MKSIKYSEVSEETRFVFDCPYCGYTQEEYEDPINEDEITCEECKEVFGIENDVY